jgi:excisionase family DNA binding protein
MPKAEVEQLLTAEEVAERLQVKVETLHQWRWQGKGPRAVKAGPKFVRYRAADVNDWIEAQTERAQSQAPPAA